MSTSSTALAARRSRTSLPLLCERAGFEFAEVWIPSTDKTEFVYVDSWSGARTTTPEVATFLESGRGMIESNIESSPFSTSFSTRTHTLCSGTDASLSSFTHGRTEKAKAAGVTNIVLVPVVYGDTSYALIALFSTSPHPIGKAVSDGVFADHVDDDAETALKAFTSYSSEVVAAAVFNKQFEPSFLVPKAPIEGKPQYLEKQAAEVFAHITADGVFAANLIYHEVDWFYSMGLQNYYFLRFDSTIMANHVHAFIAAKKSSLAAGRPEKIWLHIENNARMLGSGGKEQALYMVPAVHAQMVAAERNLEQSIARVPRDKGYSLEMFLSQRSHIPQHDARLAVYVMVSHPFADPTAIGEMDVTDIQRIATTDFLAHKPLRMQERYQEIINEVASRNSMVNKTYEKHADGTTPIMFAYQEGSGNTSSYLLQLTELLKQNDMHPERKFVERFANGTQVLSLYVAPDSEMSENAFASKLERLIGGFTLLHMVPRSYLTPFFLQGEFTAPMYAYSSCAARFIYYFINQRSDEYMALSEHLKQQNDTVNLSRLQLMHTSLKREAVSIDRIYTVMHQYNSTVRSLWEDFKLRFKPSNHIMTKADSIERADKMLNVIHRESKNDIDEQVLRAVVMFNTHVVKTNFWKSQKSALSFRLDPAFFGEADFPEVPYGIFFAMGSDFQGFHIRFRDVSRGGIRVIKSRDQHHYAQNMASLVAENYGLAYTQNKKNKDIPEFGSKGTVLLHPTAQGNDFIAFKKYISGLLDLMMPTEGEVLDYHKKTELLFLGPDEGTADYMQWAAEYAGSRDYKYWPAFTTGKPLALGGIPHDRYGMTTRSVHRYVVGICRKLGLDESEVTKLQTGGPDGDLGSNEITISKDKTKAIVDGAGVVYDPAGLDRTETTRLAHERCMVDHFDETKLGAGGFKVLVTDTNVTLPDGTLVESGLTFRNDFHLNPLSSADLFVPCGGRPESVNAGNVAQLFDAETGEPRFKYIVEGANLFFTNDARRVLEDAGVILFKDASTNKGGVTSSSLEVFAALSMEADLFEEHMAIKDPDNPTPFYNDYVNEIIQRLEHDADLEFECVWAEHERTGIARHVLTEKVSDKINQLNDFIQTSTLWDNLEIRRKVLSQVVPQSLQKMCGLDAVLERTPDNYVQAIFGSYLASRYVYKYGIDANEFAFFEFMNETLGDGIDGKK
jgi:glutamate dehydrogenase